MDQPTGGSLVVKTLESCKASVVFGIPGVHNLDIYEKLGSSSLRHVTPRHEQGAGFMADGYARVSGSPGVALVISGPGLTNILTPLGEAYHDAVPLLVISSQLPQSCLGGRTGTLHELRQSTIMSSSVTKASYAISRAEEIPWILSRAYFQTMEGRPGPVHVEIPLNILHDSVESLGEMPLGSLLSHPFQESFDMEAQELARAVKLLERSSARAIICGGGASGASKEVEKLASTLGAPVFTTAAGKGVLPEEHPLCGGCRLHMEKVRAYLETLDTVLVVGTELASADLWEMPFTRNPKVIRVDKDPACLNRNVSATVPLLGDASEVLSRLCAMVDFPDKEKVLDQTGVIKSLRENDLPSLEQLTGMGKALEPMMETLKGLRRGIPKDGVLVADMTGAAYLGLSEYPAYAPLTFLQPTGFGTLGYSLPGAIGAKLACPRKPVCAFSGDGGFQFTLPELATACEESLSLPIVLWNNRGYGEIRRNQQARRWNSLVAVDLYTPDFSALAAAYHISGETVLPKEDALVAALERAWERNAPSLIEIRSEREVG